MSSRPLFSLRCSFVIGLILLCVSGCASDRSRHEGREPDGEARARIPEMAAERILLNDQITAEVVLNRAGFASRGDQPDGAARRDGGIMRGGGRRGHGIRGSSDEPDQPRVHIVASHEPPVQLHLRLTNRMAVDLSVEILQFDSELGNFAVQPARVSIPAHGTVEVDPMTSQLGVTEAEIPLTLKLRANGIVDSEILLLKITAPDAAAAPASLTP